jgi:hypothetical protein
VPGVVFFEGGVEGLREAKQIALKQWKSYESLQGPLAEKPPYSPPVFVSLVSYSEWLVLSQSVQSGVPSLPPTVYTGYITTAKGKDRVSNTWIFAWVDSVSRAKQYCKTPEDRRTAFKSAKDTTLADDITEKLLVSLTPLMVGDRAGHSFVGQEDTTIDEGPSLASLLVERYTNPCETVWDLCKNRPLISLPMAAMVAERYYVAVAGPGITPYQKMVKCMQDVNFLKDNCDVLYDGKWAACEGNYHRTPVSILSLPVGLVLA